MPRQVSIADARDHLPALIRDAEEGCAIELTRRGKPVALLVSIEEYRSLVAGKRDLWTAIEDFRAKHDLSDLHPEEIWSGVRDPSPGREVDL